MPLFPLAALHRAGWKRVALFLLLVVMVLAIGFLHTYTPGQYRFFHDTYRRLAYFPIVLGALWYGLWGGVVISVLASFAFIPHLVLYISGPPQAYLSELTEVVLYIAAGVVTGFIAGREARLRRRYEELSVKLERSYRRLARQARQLLEVEQQLAAGQQLSALGRLAASLAHEIKNPLASIRGIGEIFQDEFPPGHEKHEFARMLTSEVDRLDRTVREMLHLSRAERRPAAAGELQPLSEVLARVCKLVAHHLERKGIALHHGGDGDAARGVLCDGDKMVQVFLNILLNAIDELAQGGNIWLRVERRDASSVAVVVSDDGPGIPEERREEIFAPFVSGKENGTGLGLAISRRIVEHHGGSVTCCESQHGGACFTILLPRRPRFRQGGRGHEELLAAGSGAEGGCDERDDPVGR